MADAVPAVSVSPALGGTMADAAPSFTVEVPPQNLIHAEILSVTSAMQKNQRWASAAAAAASSYAAMPFRPSSSSSSAGVAVGDGLFRREGETLKGHSGRQVDQPLR
ncbi:hypothetical protein JCM10213_000186 [Rhodosporidiobolus nylandii]